MVTISTGITFCKASVLQVGRTDGKQTRSACSEVYILTIQLITDWNAEKSEINDEWFSLGL